MRDSPEFTAGLHQGAAERMVWLLRTVSNAQSLPELRKCVDAETRRIFPEYYPQARRR